MRIVGADITGSLIINGNDVTTTIQSSNAWSGSSSTRLTSLESFSSSLNNVYATDEQLAAATASLISSTNTLSSSLTSTVTSLSSSLLSAITSLSSSMTSTVGALSSSYAISSASLSTRVTTNETNISALQSASGSLALRAKLIEDQYATTGSNTFTGTQNVTNTTAPTGFSETTAAIYTAGGLQVTKNAYFSSSLYIKGDLTVYGTQSISYITSSQLNISDNIISVNTATPAVRFGGIEVYDSGSTGLTGSLLWDSQNNRWIYSNPSGSSYDGGMLISGPRNSSGLGNEQGTLNNYVMKGQGGDHITSSQIIDNGTTVSIPGNLQVTGSLYAANLTGSLNGSNLIDASVTNAKLANSSVTVTAGTGMSGGGAVSLGSSVTLTNAGVTSNVAGTGITVSGATGAVTITNAGVTSIVAGTGISINQGTGAVTVTNTITNTNQLTNGAGFLSGTVSVSNGGTGATSRKAASSAIANFGQLEDHGTYTDANSVQQWGGTYIQGSTNGHGFNGSTQYYQMMLSLGANYDWGSGNTYACQIAISRNVSTPYIGIRYKEGGNNTANWNSWQKISAGYADSAGSLSSMNISQFTNNSGYITGTTGGNFTINNSSPTIYLQDTDHRSSMIHCNSNIFYVLRGSTTNTTSWSTYNGYWPLEINLENNNATFGGNITAIYDVTAYSDIRVKKNVNTIEKALDKVNKMRGVTYQRTDMSDDKTHIGVIAQEIQEILPEVVSENEKGYLNVAYGNIVGLLIEAVKEQQAQIEELKAKLG